MKDLVASFAQHLREAVGIATHVDLKKPGAEVRNVLILGMGGSGIGGTIAAQVLSDLIFFPVHTCKDYDIPAFVSDHTLVIASSYSGNTEETISAVEQAALKTKLIYCICSGGQLLDWARSKNFSCIQIPSGYPPRAAFGYSFPQLFRIFQVTGLLQMDLISSFGKAVELLEREEENIRSLAGKAATALRDKITVIYSSPGFEGVAIRFRQQLNENSKKLCWHHVLPEMNHNELVGWRETNDKLAVVFLENADDHPRTVKRRKLTEEVVRKYAAAILHIDSKGINRLERTLYLIHLCDWISVLVADLNGVDAVEVDIITFLKGELTKQ